MRTILLLAALSAAGAATAAPRPDLSGVWTNASVTLLTRPPGSPGPQVSPAQAAAAGNPGKRMMERATASVDPAQGAPRAGDTSGIGAGWAEPGAGLGKVRGTFRSSWIVDPADGALPLSVEGQRRVAEARAFARRADTPEGPEAMQPWDRCLISSRGSGGPGMLNNIYNSNYQIVQTPGAVAIVVEMVHDARIVPLFPDKASAQAAHGPAVLHRWLGDSTGWWEGGVLVVETVNVNAEQGRAGPIFLTPAARVTERFSREGAVLNYAFEVEDPAYYTRPWRAEMVMTAKSQPLYEYACHEGNYALPNILRGVRVAEGGAAR